MEHEGFLTTIAEVAIAIAGFSGIVAALGGRTEGEWSEPDRVRLRLLLVVSFNTVIGSFLPLFLFAAGVVEKTWRVTSAIWFVYIAGTLLYRIPQILRARGNASGEASWPFVLAMLVSTTTILFLQIVNALYWDTAWPFLLALLEGLVLGFVLFVRLLRVMWVSE